MKKVLNLILMVLSKNRKIADIALIFLLRLHNFCYSAISTLATGENGGLHPKHRLTNYHEFFIDNISSQDTVLDIGCGNGFLTHDVAKKAKFVAGIDLNKKNVETAQKKFAAENIEYIHGDATSYEFGKHFDVIILSNVLEHIKNRVEFLLRIKSLADKFLFRVPMINRDWLVYYKRGKKIDYLLDPTHYIEYTYEDFEKELREAGMQIEKYSIQFGEIWAVIRRG